MDAVTVDYEYNEHGYRSKLKHGEAALVEVTEQTAYGQSRAERYGNGVRTRRDYDKLGRLSDIDTIRRGGATIQDNTYAWRSDGSLQRRAARAGSRVRREFLDYDYLNRLTRAATRIGGSSTASRTLTFGYDLRGNLTTKTSDVAADDDTTGYDYYAGTNRLREATIGNVEYEFPHDTSGHIEQYECTDPDDSDEVDPCDGVDDTFIDWNARGLAEKVMLGESKTDTMPAARDSFRYGPDGARYFKKTDWPIGPSTSSPQSPRGPRYLAQDACVGGKDDWRPRGMVARQQPLARLAFVGAFDDQAVAGQEHEYPSLTPSPSGAVDEDRATFR